MSDFRTAGYRMPVLVLVLSAHVALYAMLALGWPQQRSGVVDAARPPDAALPDASVASDAQPGSMPLRTGVRTDEINAALAPSSPDAPQRSRQPASQSPGDGAGARYRAGREFDARRRAWVDKHNRMTYGEEIAGLMRGPLAEAWPELERRALSGDTAASEAMLELGCTSPDEEFSNFSSFSNDMSTRVSRGDASFVLGVLDAERDAYIARGAECRALGFGLDRMRGLIAERGVALPPPTEAPLGDWSSTLDAWRELVGGAFAPPWQVQDAGARRLFEAIHSQEYVPNIDDMAVLRRAAEHDPVALGLLASCLRAQCKDIPGFAAAERIATARRAAFLGFEHAIIGMVQDARESRDAAATYAWAVFGRDLALAGCLDQQPSGAFLFFSIDLAKSGDQLTPELRRQAELVAQRWRREHGNSIAAVQGCVVPP